MNLLQKADDLAAQTTDALRNAKLVIGLAEISGWSQNMWCCPNAGISLALTLLEMNCISFTPLTVRQLCSHGCDVAFCHLPDCASGLHFTVLPDFEAVLSRPPRKSTLPYHH
jgi:hypothetical protein